MSLDAVGAAIGFGTSQNNMQAATLWVDIARRTNQRTNVFLKVAIETK